MCVVLEGGGEEPWEKTAETRDIPAGDGELEGKKNDRNGSSKREIWPI